MTSGQETDRAYSNKKPQFPEPVWGPPILLSSQTKGHLILLLNWYPHFLDKNYARVYSAKEELFSGLFVGLSVC